MASATRPLPHEIGGRGSAVALELAHVGRAPRERVVRMVEYTRFPRVAEDPGLRVGFTRDESATGMCLGVEQPERTGELLRVVVRGVDGQPTLDALVRVVWCQERPDGRFWIGLAVVREGRRSLLKVEHRRRARRVAVTA